jgi:hypothetical protein
MMKIAAEGDFEAVASTICAGPAPQWLSMALAHYAVWIDGSDHKEVQTEFNKRIQQMQEAVRVLKNSLPMWENLGFNAECPPACLGSRRNSISLAGREWADAQMSSGRSVQQSSWRPGASFMAGSKPVATNFIGPATNTGRNVVGHQLVPKVISRNGAGRSVKP